MLYFPACIPEPRQNLLTRVSRTVVQSLMRVAQHRYQDCILYMHKLLKPQDKVLYFGAGAGGAIVDYAIHEHIELYLSDIDSRAYRAWQKLMKLKHWSKKHIHYAPHPVDAFNAHQVLSMCKKIKPTMILIIGLFEYFDVCRSVQDLGKNMISVEKIRMFLCLLKCGCKPGTMLLFTFPNVLNKKTAFVQ